MSNIDLKDEILNSIALHGSAALETASIIPVIAGNDKNLGHILNLSSGSPRIHSSIIKRFSLILGMPKPLTAMSALSIRCALCNSVISYPCWYYTIRYAVNQFHYFVCFNPTEPGNVTAKCYKRK